MPQRQKFHSDDVNQCLPIKFGSHGFFLVDFGKVLCSYANELQQKSNASSGEEYIPQILNCFVRFIAFTFDLCSLLTFCFRRLCSFLCLGFPKRLLMP